MLATAASCSKQYSTLTVISPTEVEAQFGEYIVRLGIDVVGTIVADDALHRLHVAGHRRGSRNLAYILHFDGRPAGWFCEYKSGKSGTWTADGRAYRPDPEMRRKIEQERRRRAQELLEKQERTSRLAQYLWRSASPCVRHSYLDLKGVQAHGVRVCTWERGVEIDGRWFQFSVDDTLIVPVRDISGRIWNLQAIFPHGHEIVGHLGRNKDFLSGGRKAGLMHWMGSGDSIFICEGYATAASVLEHVGGRVVVAFDCGNLKAVGLAVRAKYQTASITFCADNDLLTEGNPGVTKAREAALAVNGLISIPEFPDGLPGDWNDFYREVANGG